MSPITKLPIPSVGKPMRASASRLRNILKFFFFKNKIKTYLMTMTLTVPIYPNYSNPKNKENKENKKSSFQQLGKAEGKLISHPIN